jgi:cell division protein FtsN
MAADDSERRILTRKELAKEQRQAAYKKAKEQRATDPRHLAMKEAAREQRRAQYQKLKQGRAGETAAKKTKASKLRVVQRDTEVLASEAQSKRIAERCRAAAAAPEPRANPAVDLGAELQSELRAYFSWNKPSDVVN